ncbi:NgoMIV family type II restriction endonuclease [Kiloniella sp. EL199]|uniref:NgoMIV family type II restriction endonuclease n=1 Tax=Kiloniella sp. EL199 TaxID=2107581 RepID=UPI000EA0E7D8|nr:NgoMIV family type II restriction endonuclease [Kiloniella sp. EL199]
MSLFNEERTKFHKQLLTDSTLCLTKSNGDAQVKWGVDYIASVADTGQAASVKISNLLVDKISKQAGVQVIKVPKKPQGQRLGNQFEIACRSFIDYTFSKLGHLRPGQWTIQKIDKRTGNLLGEFEQYSHLAELETLMEGSRELRTFLGEGYTIAPDIVILRSPVSDEDINTSGTIVDDHVALRSMLRKRNHRDRIHPILHASISCKFTMRSDRAQNTRTEALNLIRSRKGRSPHIVAVTAEPTASRIASLALGTGDIDCVYHFALNELRATYVDLNREDALDMLDAMIEGKRLKDISDLPLDLAV